MDDLLGLLDAERSALIAGDFERIAQLAEQKERLAGRADALPQDADGLARVEGALRRNQQLFDAALTGLRAVSERIAALREGRIETYLEDGRKQSISEVRPDRLERRA